MQCVTATCKGAMCVQTHFGSNLRHVCVFGLRSPNCFLQNCWSSTAFDSIVIRSFKICNWFIGLFNHFHRLPEVFKIHILYLDQFLGQIWAQKTKKMPIVDFLLLFVSIFISFFGLFKHFYQLFGIQHSNFIFGSFFGPNLGQTVDSDGQKPAENNIAKSLIFSALEALLLQNK